MSRTMCSTPRIFIIITYTAPASVGDAMRRFSWRRKFPRPLSAFICRRRTRFPLGRLQKEINFAAQEMIKPPQKGPALGLGILVTNSLFS